jgi:Chromosome segregation ATPases
MLQKRLIKVTVIFFLFIILFTLISRIAEGLTIPRVVVTQPERMSIEHEITAMGRVGFAQERAVSSLAEQVVDAVAVSIGQNVVEGELLYIVNGTHLSSNIQKKEEEILVLELQIEQASSSNSVLNQRYNMELNQAREEYDRVVERENKAVFQLEQELKEVERLYEEYEKEPEKFSEMTKEMLQELIREKQDSYERGIENRNESISNVKDILDRAAIQAGKDTTVEQISIQLTQLERELSEWKALQEIEGNIYSEYSGIITEINIQAGSITTGISDILIGDYSTGVEIVASFEEENRNYLERGGKVVLYEGEQIIRNGDTEIFLIQGIFSNKEDSTLTDITVEIPPNIVDIGKQVKISVEMPRNEYATCIPRAALNKDNYGQYFVYSVVEHNSVLGDELKVIMLNVEVLDGNRQYVAVEGIMSEDEIVVSTTKMLNKDSRVRLRGNE